MMIVMTTSHSASNRRSSAVLRMFDWLLDREGDIYGDERSRFRWYEAIAAAGSIQWIVFPAVMAVMVWIAPPSAAPYLAVAFAAFVLPIYVTLPYLHRHRIDFSRRPKSRKGRLVFWSSLIPLAVFILGLTVGLDLRSGTAWSEISAGLLGGLVGGLIGIGVASLVVVWIRRRVAVVASSDDELD